PPIISCTIKYFGAPYFSIISGRVSKPPARNVGKEMWQPAAERSERKGAKAFRTTSATACCAKCRFPTAAGRAGLRKLPLGMLIWTGRLQPPLLRESISVRQRIAYRVMAQVEENGQFKAFWRCLSVPVKSI